jgi:ATP-dependent DNA helicase RecQ
MRDSDVERLKSKVGLGDEQSRLTIATIHKVKGLQYDTVLIMPSTGSFPFSGGSGRCRAPTVVDAAEEARLYYVAMTRARNRLYGGWGDRERAWWECRLHAGGEDARFCLKGSPKECFVSWPGQKDQVHSGLQAYIERQVCLRDPLELRDRRCLRHDGQTVGLLSKSAATLLHHANASPQLRVSNVIRYTCGNYFREHKPDFWEKLDDAVKRQGWFYLVLAEEA